MLICFCLCFVPGPESIPPFGRRNLFYQEEIPLSYFGHVTQVSLSLSLSPLSLSIYIYVYIYLFDFNVAFRMDI